MTKLTAAGNVLFTISSGQRAKPNRKGIAIIPEILPCDISAFADIGPSAIRQARLCECDKTGMPQTQDDSGSKSGLPIRLRSDNLVHQCEESVRVVLDLDIHVKLDMAVLRLQNVRFKSSSDNQGRRNVGNM